MANNWSFIANKWGVNTHTGMKSWNERKYCVYSEQELAAVEHNVEMVMELSHGVV